MHRVSIKNESEDIRPTYVSIDGQPIEKVVSVNFSQSVDTVPTCEIEVRALPDIEALADVQFQFTPQTIQEAVKVLRHSLIENESLYTAFLISIDGALREVPAEAGLHYAAKKVLDRIIGEECQ